MDNAPAVTFQLDSTIDSDMANRAENPKSAIWNSDEKRQRNEITFDTPLEQFDADHRRLEAVNSTNNVIININIY